MIKCGGATAQGGTDDGDDSLGQGGDGEDGVDDGEDGIRIGVDDSEERVESDGVDEELGGGEQ